MTYVICKIDLAHHFQRRRNVDDGDGRISSVERALQCRSGLGIAMNAAVPDGRQAAQHGLGKHKLRARKSVLLVGFDR